MVQKVFSAMFKELVKQLMKLWNVWDVEGCIICSLMLQVFLVFVASCRKRNSKKLKFISPFIWLAYLVADGVAILSLGLLLDRMRSNRKGKRYKDLLAFWSPFLLLHLGGPDTITAFALEDNELWLRNMLKLFVQLSTTGYILSQSLPHNQLLIPTLLMFVVGTVRYAERICALYLASDDGFKSLIPKRADPGTNHLKLIHEYVLNLEAGIPTSIEIPSEPTSIEIPSEHESEASTNGIELKTVKIAHEFFTTFKCMIADLLLGINETYETRDYLLKRDANLAFKLMDIELEFAYDILYTKAQVVHSRPGYITRAICFSSVLTSFFYFFFFFDEHQIHEADINVTYALLCSALALDLISFIQLIFSNWTAVYLYKNPLLRSIIHKFSGTVIPIIHKVTTKNERSMIMSQYNLIDSCLFNHKHFKFIERRPWTTAIYKPLNIFKHTKYDKVDLELKEFIFAELKRKTGEVTNVESAKRLCSSRGRWALQNRGCFDELKWTIGVEFEESILLWHIATDMCLNNDDRENHDIDQMAISVSVSKKRHVSKLLSEYLLYLLIRRPKMISSIEGVRQIKYRDASEEIMSVLEDSKEDKAHTLKNLLELGQSMPKESKLVLFDACYLVTKLNGMSVTIKWEIISEVLVELLCYAACQCRGSYHAEGLSRGGELVTHVWFLMAHLGLGQMFHVASSHAKARVIVKE